MPYSLVWTPVRPLVPGEIQSVVEGLECRIHENCAFPMARYLSATKPNIVSFSTFKPKPLRLLSFSAPQNRTWWEGGRKEGKKNTKT
ncbi:hypothetical protein MTP99_001315 [Tenebrio molitor]|nr:hypothetical protein MTP99_001315 [Tenebrio molitor]